MAGSPGASTFCALIAASLAAAPAPASGPTRQSIEIRGHRQSLHVQGSLPGDPVIVSSGDGGWIHLGPHVAEFLGSRGFFVIGFDVKAYLSGFTVGRSALQPRDVPGDYRELTRLARQATGKRPILIGVSEGAGLSVLAATDPATKRDVAGVVALGLPDVNELGWRWKDALIYLTHRAPDEPVFSAAAIVDRVAPVPLAAIHATRDEYVPVAEVERVLSAARDPKRLRLVNASNHRFSGNLNELDRQLLDAIAWVKANAAR